MAARRPAAGIAAALALLVLAVVSAPPPPHSPPLSINVLLVITDDQTFDTLPSYPAAMPWLQSQLADPGSGWVHYPEAVVSTPMCCPSRASILTGLDAWTTGVLDNDTGWRLDESDTIATRLQDAGYRTGLVGKYLNHYPWGRGPYIPAGWDRWFAKTNDAEATTYGEYHVVDQGAWRMFGRGPADYVTDVVGREALAFVRGAPNDRPWFLVFAPPAPHAPWTPAPRHVGAFEDLVLPPPPDEVVNDVAGKPAWMQALPPIDAAMLASLQQDRVHARETLLAVDEYVRSLVDAALARGEWDRTAVIFLSDNGYHFGEHRWIGKQTPYEPSIRVPFVIRWPPGIEGAPPDTLVANLDVAPTVASLAGVDLGPVDGLALTRPVQADRSIRIGWVGDEEVPAWRGRRVPGAVFVAWATGETESYDLTVDPDETGG